MRVIYDQVKAGRPGRPRRPCAASSTRWSSVARRRSCSAAPSCPSWPTTHDLLDDPLYVDSLDVLARRTIERAGHRLR